MPENNAQDIHRIRGCQGFNRTNFRNLSQKQVVFSFTSVCMGSLKPASSLSSSNASTRFWSLATNSIRSEANVAKDRELALSHTLDSCPFSTEFVLMDSRGQDVIGLLIALSEVIDSPTTRDPMMMLWLWGSPISLREFITTWCWLSGLSLITSWMLSCSSGSSFTCSMIPQLSEFTRRYDFSSIFIWSSSAAWWTSWRMSPGLNLSIFSTLFPSTRSTFAPSVPTLWSSFWKTFLLSSGALNKEEEITNETILVHSYAQLVIRSHNYNSTQLDWTETNLISSTE